MRLKFGWLVIGFFFFFGFGAGFVAAEDPYAYDHVTTLINKQTLVHLFEWKWTDVATECENFLQQHGYGAVQISPPQEHITLTVNNDLPWYVRYQPVSYKLTSRGGNEQELIDMINRCNKVGVRIIVDVVLNHMVGIGQKKGVNGVGSSGDSDFDATAPVQSFPGVPFTKEHTHYKECDHDIQDSDYQNSAYDVRMCRLVGLIDLDQGNAYVRTKIQEYLNILVSYGVAGFRFDASKHMWPTDLDNILTGVNNLRADIFGNNVRPLVVHEVIDRGGEAVKVSEYIGIGRYTNFNFGAAVSAAAKGQSSWSDLLKLGPGFGYGNLDDFDVLNFIDNHDNQRDTNPYVATYKDGDKYKHAVAFMLAWSYGLPRVMSSYNFSTSAQGPPSYGAPDFKTKSPTFDSGTQTCSLDSGWVCEHRWPEIRKMALFRQAVSGTAPTLLYANNGIVAFARFQKGFFALNTQNGDSQITVPTSLPPGDYCDVYNGDINNNACTGAKITVSSNGQTTITVPGNSITAIHVEARIGGVPTPPVVPASWKRTILMIRRPTKPGQAIFIRGGNTQHGSCAVGDFDQPEDRCAIPIKHDSNASFFYAGYNMWRQGDTYLDFEGAERQQGTHDGTQAVGTPAFWTTNDAKQPEYRKENTYGADYWYVELLVDCASTSSGWLEFKAFENNGIGWEPDIQQTTCTGNVGGSAPFNSNNHLARCGYVNVFEWEEPSCIIQNL